MIRNAAVFADFLDPPFSLFRTPICNVLGRVMPEVVNAVTDVRHRIRHALARFLSTFDGINKPGSFRGSGLDERPRQRARFALPFKTLFDVLGGAEIVIA